MPAAFCRRGARRRMAWAVAAAFLVAGCLGAPAPEAPGALLSEPPSDLPMQPLDEEEPARPRGRSLFSLPSLPGMGGAGCALGQCSDPETQRFHDYVAATSPIFAAGGFTLLAALWFFLCCCTMGCTWCCCMALCDWEAVICCNNLPCCSWCC